MSAPTESAPIRAHLILTVTPGGRQHPLRLVRQFERAQHVAAAVVADAHGSLSHWGIEDANESFIHEPSKIYAEVTGVANLAYIRIVRLELED
jgi:hypothetical protein